MQPIWRPLDWLHFFLADVRGGFGPYLGIFLLTREGWNPAAIGLLATVAGLAGMIFNAPAGAVIDATRHKRATVIVAAALLAAGAVAVALRPSFTVVLASNTVMAVVGDVFGPAVAAITLGLMPAAMFAWRTGRNAAFDHAGNVAIALAAAAVGWWLGQRAVFFLVPLFALAVTASVLAIPAGAIDHARARGSDGHDGGGRREDHASGVSVLVTCRPLLVLAVCTGLFHFANAPMLHLVGQKLALANAGKETAFMSACVIAAQVVMLPMSVLVGRRADAWGRKPLCLAALMVLPLRGVLYTLSENPAWLVTVQLLDGVGNGLFATLTPIIVADLMRGTGRYNLALGTVATVQGIGASLSSVVAGVIVVWAGYSAAFVALAAIALVGLLVLALLMPETAPRGDVPHRQGAKLRAGWPPQTRHTATARDGQGRRVQQVPADRIIT
jgi:MFS family permease